MMIRKWLQGAVVGLLASLGAVAVGCGGDGGTTTGTGGAGGGGAKTPDCDTYCTTVTANCTGANAVYVSAEVCKAACKHMPVGAAADTTGNTLGCRSYHAGAAAGDPATHCQHAGPGGADYCGSNCDGYCNLAQGACKTFASDMECQTACAAFTSTAKPFSSADITGDTRECRLYHASVASADATHCPHIGLTPSAGTCTNP